MNVVIIMGGIGARFRRAGYSVPKYEIEVRGKTLFDWSLLSLKEFWKESFIFLVRRDDHAGPFIQEHCRRMGISPIVIELERTTKGQAETAALASRAWDGGAPLLVYNIDTYVEEGQLSPRQMSGDGMIPCFSAEGSHWSFVRTDASGQVVEVREKSRISGHCSIGAYYFGSAELYLDIYRDFYGDGINMEMGEQYIAPMYNRMIEKGYHVKWQDIPPEYVHVLGTPEEVERFRAGV